MILVKSTREIELMKRAGHLVALVLAQIQKKIGPGISTKELDLITEELITREGCAPAFKGYRGFPASICASINDIVVHGIPSRTQILKNGDLVSIDVGVANKGYCADGARSFLVGKGGGAAKRLLDVTRGSLYKGIDEARPGRRLSNISHAVQEYVEGHGFSVVRALVGHGIGANIHEDPEIANYGPPNQGPLLKPGMTLAIEPMVNEGSYDVEVLSDGWAVATKDNKLSAHFEHTIVITDDKAEILTQWQKKKQ